MKTGRWLTPLGCVMLLGSAILHSSGYIRLVHRIEAAGIQFPLAGILKVSWWILAVYFVTLAVIAVLASRMGRGVCWRQHCAALLLSGRLSRRLPACGCLRALPDWRLAASQTKTSRLVSSPGWGGFTSAAPQRRTARGESQPAGLIEVSVRHADRRSERLAQLAAGGIYESTVKAVLEAHFGAHNSLVIYQSSESHIETDPERARPRHIGPSEARAGQPALAYQAPPFIRVPHCSAYVRHVVGCTAQRAGPGAAPN